MIKGYDVSNVNGHELIIPRDAEFVIAKVTQDSAFVDKVFSTHRGVARAREIGFGGYHYADNKEQPDAEASCNFFLEHLGEQRNGEIAALAVELDTGHGGFDANSSASQPWVLRWGQVFVRENNYKPKLYTSKAGIVDFDLNTREITELYDLWYAWWSSSGEADTLPSSPKPWYTLGTKFKLWQYNAEKIDKNVFLGSLEEFKATGKPVAKQPAYDYEALCWAPIYKILNNMIVETPPEHLHANAAFHAAMSNTVTLHKIALGVEQRA